MKIKGVDYDLGVFYMEGISSHPSLNPSIVKRELQIIKNDLHCNAVRICAQDIERLAFAGACALEQGLEVWFAPRYVDASEPEMLHYLGECAQAAEKLRQTSPNVVFVAGSELTLLMNGILEGANFLARLGNPANWERIRRGEHNQPLDDFLAKAASEIRRQFRGPLTYASLPIELVDWRRFDFVGVDHYRAALNRDKYREALKRYLIFGKPVIITEFGCCTYRGSEDQGARGHEVIDFSTNPPHIRGDLVRDEAVQARELVDLIRIFDDVNVDGAFVYTFAMPTFTYSENSKYDLDMAGYGLVKSYANTMGTTYPGLPWDPKESFYAVAEYYATQSAHITA
jgi:hypothetical protein